MGSARKEAPVGPQPGRGPVLTVDGEVHPAAVVEGVILLVQHEHFALVPALVLGANLLQPQRSFVVKTRSAWGQADKSPGVRPTPRHPHPS